jgi:hypothetical protein
MASDFELAKAEMEKLLAWAAANDSSLRRNEAETRLHLIDQILFNCLGWGREDCHVEERLGGKYADYILGTPRRVILEAKREGTYFELPAGLDKRVLRLTTVMESGPTIGGAILQCLSYCSERGTHFGAVSNGHQVVVFIGSRTDGVPPVQGYCLVFTSLEDMLRNFRTLWDNLSQPGVLSYVLHSTLMVAGAPPPPEKLSQRIPGYPGFKNRNPFQTDLKILGELFIEDVAKAPELEEEFLKEAYCPSGALSQYALISKRILQARYSSLFEKELAGPTLEPAQTKRGLADNLAADVLAASLKRRPVVLLGDVGVGKTIFIRHLVKVAAPDVFEKAIALYIDFGREPALAEDLENFVLRRCADQLRDQHRIDIDEDGFVRGVYHAELARFGKGIYGPLAAEDPSAYSQKEIGFLEEKLKQRAAHLRACLTHISKAHLRQVVIFLDNVDQRPAEFQDRVFLIGQSLAETWPATVFISLRPDTFFRSKAKGSLAAYQPRVFTISPPRIDQVLTLRLEFVSRQIQSSGTFRALPAGLTVRSESLARYVRVLLDSFRRSERLMEFIDNLSGGNTRRALDFVTAFVGSGHVNAEKILDIAEEFGSYTIPIHEFMRAVIYGDCEHFDPAASPIVNLFDISTPDGREHFLLANVLAVIERLGSTSADEGFVASIKVYDFCQGLGFTPTQIKFALDRACLTELLEPSPRFSGGPVASYRITTAGAYTFRELPRHFSYVDAMIVDTPVVDPETRGAIPDANQISERLDRLELFRKYLDAQHSPLTLRSVAFDWPTASQAIASDAAKIRESERRRSVSRNMRLPPRPEPG